MSMENTLNGSKSQFSLEDLMKALQETEDGQRPVEKWNPKYCGEMDMIIKSDGSWWHDGSRITRKGLVSLFASILRKDEDERTYLVTPVEKIGIQVERGHFLATRVDIEGEGEFQRVFFTTNLDEVIKVGPEHPLRVETDLKTMEPSPYVTVRGRLDAALARSVFYEIVEQAAERRTDKGKQLGLYASGVFFPLGPAGAHEV